MKARISNAFYNRINRILGPRLEALLYKRGDVDFIPPIFIVGAPRCGSTLVMQVITDAFDVGYLTNRHCRWFGAPGLAEKWLRPLSKKKPSDYQSVHGRTRGETAPSECGAWWYRFFGRNSAYVTEADVSKRKMRAFRRSILALQHACEKPLIFKNLYAGLRLELIARYVPESFIVVVERNCVENAHSLLKGRKSVHGSYECWWALPPPNVAELAKLPAVQQVVGQIESICRLIHRDLNRLGLGERTFRIQYEDLCDDVHGTLDRFESFMAEQDVLLKRRFEVPACFKVSRSVEIPQAMYKQLVNYVAERDTRRPDQT